MPGGKRLWVHPATPEDAAFVNRQVMREVKALPSADDQDRAIEIEVRLKVWQCIRVCRQGPERNAPLAFQPEDADLLRRNGALQTINRIVAVSDSLGGGEDLLPEVVRAFFGRVASCVRTCASQLPTDSPEWTGLRQRLEGLGGCVSRVNETGAVTLSDLAGVPE